MFYLRLAGTLLLAAAGALAVSQDQQALPPGPQLIHEAVFEPEEIPENFSVRTLVLEIPAGAQTPLHHHPGPGIVLILEGELVSADENGQETVHAVGDTFEEMPGQVHMVRNETDSTVRILFTILLPDGEDLTTVVE